MGTLLTTLHYPHHRITAGLSASTSGSSLLAMGGLVLGAVALALRYLRRPSPTTLEPLPMVESNVAMAATTGEPRRRVVVTGLGIASVFGNDVDEYYDALLEGKSGIKMIDKFDTVRYDVRPNGIKVPCWCIISDTR